MIKNLNFIRSIKTIEIYYQVQLNKVNKYFNKYFEDNWNNMKNNWKEIKTIITFIFHLMFLEHFLLTMLLLVTLVLLLTPLRIILPLLAKNKGKHQLIS